MARIFITGSADGLGLLAAKELIGLGHQVVLHARNEERADQAQNKVPGAENVLVADLSSIEESRTLAAKANESGAFDVVIHNAGVYQVPRNSTGAKGLPLLLAVNTLAPYILTALMYKPKRLIYMSSGMHLQGDTSVRKITDLPNLRNISYSDTKLHDLIIAKAVAHRWSDVYSNAIDPGWVPTKMGGAGAPDDLEKGYETQVWLAGSNDAEACVSGCYFHHKRQSRYHTAADDVSTQEQLLSVCEQITGVVFH